MIVNKNLLLPVSQSPLEIYCQGPAMTRLQKPKHLFLFLQIELQLTDTLEQETFPIQNFSPHPKNTTSNQQKPPRSHRWILMKSAMNPHLKPLPFSNPSLAVHQDSKKCTAAALFKPHWRWESDPPHGVFYQVFSVGFREMLYAVILVLTLGMGLQLHSSTTATTRGRRSQCPGGDIFVRPRFLSPKKNWRSV